MNILLQILDEGKITDAQGRTVSFENTVIIMTSNAGSELKSTTLGFNKEAGQVAKDKAEKALKDFLRPEFLGRIDEVVLFRPLDLENFKDIAVLMLSELKEPLAEKGISLQYDDEALAEIARMAFGKASGARDIRRVLRREVEDRISSIVIEQADHLPNMILVTAEDQKIKLVTR
jgi:ATP-dependent Clp protease ATP-binding subunit ClpA